MVPQLDFREVNMGNLFVLLLLAILGHSFHQGELVCLVEGYPG